MQNYGNSIRLNVELSVDSATQLSDEEMKELMESLSKILFNPPLLPQNARVTVAGIAVKESPRKT